MSAFRKGGNDYFAPETKRELLRTGLMGDIWGAQIYTSPEIAQNAIYLVTEPEYFGVMPIRMDLTVLPADDPKARTFGWSIFQQIGIGIHNPEKGLQKINLTA